MNNVTELRNQLSEIFYGLRAKTVDHRDASQFANLAGKMISSAKVQLEYYALRKEQPNIKFLVSEDGKTKPAINIPVKTVSTGKKK